MFRLTFVPDLVSDLVSDLLSDLVSNLVSDLVPDLVSDLVSYLVSDLVSNLPSEQFGNCLSRGEAVSQQTQKPRKLLISRFDILYPGIH